MEPSFDTLAQTTCHSCSIKRIGEDVVETVNRKLERGAIEDRLTARVVRQTETWLHEVDEPLGF